MKSVFLGIFFVETKQKSLKNFSRIFLDPTKTNKGFENNLFPNSDLKLKRQRCIFFRFSAFFVQIPEEKIKITFFLIPFEISVFFFRFFPEKHRNSSFSLLQIRFLQGNFFKLSSKSGSFFYYKKKHLSLYFFFLWSQSVLLFGRIQKNIENFAKNFSTFLM